MKTENCFSWISQWQTLPNERGAYLLWIELQHDAPAPPKFNTILAPGIYLYAGSAKGSGGIQSRCCRHFRKRKKLHWHVDWLTSAASHVQALAVFELSECDVFKRINLAIPTKITLTGLGSSDCRNCRTHLMMCPDGHTQETIKALFEDNLFPIKNLAF